MNFSIKDTFGFLALFLGVGLSVLLLNKKKLQEAPEAQDSEVFEEKPISAENQKKRNEKSSQTLSSHLGGKYLKTTLGKPNKVLPLDRESKELLAFLECYETESCNFPDNDPREYRWALGQAVGRSFKKATSRILNQKEPQPHFWKDSALEAIQISDSYVKATALDIIATQEISDKALDRILNYVIDYHDPSLIPQALAELQKYFDSPQNRKHIYQRLAQNLESGSLLVRSQLVKGLMPFINKESLPYFLSTLKKVKVQSKVHSHLYKLIQEYKRLQTGA